MRIITVEKKDEGQRLDKLLIKYFKNAPSSFVYKMLRKKNITLNGKKAIGNEKILSGDEIKLFLSEDTIVGFQYENKNSVRSNISTNLIEKLKSAVIYEDNNLLAVNKWAGVLSQKSKESDISLNEIALEYLIKKGDISAEDLNVFKPSVCNRLDRNTTGVILIAKTYIMANALSKSLKDRTSHKYYHCLVKGRLEKEFTVKGYLIKDSLSNKVAISTDELSGGQYIETGIKPIKSGDKVSYLEVELFTGKTHQIRAHLASINHPIVGDEKYGAHDFNSGLKEKFSFSYQLLHSYKTILSDFDGDLSYLSGLEIVAPIPDVYKEIINVYLEK